MTISAGNEEILAYARSCNWLKLSSTEGNILNTFLTPAGIMLEVYFDKKKVSIKPLSSFNGK